MKYSNYDIYIKTLYINAGKSVMDRLFSVFTPYIRYDNLYYIYNKTLITPQDNNYIFNDSYGAFFHKLCCKLSNDIYKADLIYYILSPYHNEDVIFQMLIPEKNSDFTNNLFHNQCKDNKLYTNKKSDKFSEYLDFANDFFKKSEKIQQE